MGAETGGSGAALVELPIAWEHTGDGELPYRDPETLAEGLMFRRQRQR